ncbi:hypothetical protein BDB00DRAFT_885175 [Zychaea mexicana]|uniref:uncharacterized protein n=1 Tax=Zychaea mexicana TaxID=64656 RepID=UPI0022FDB5D4|nr:uncharacterized protein BDB00DRAFT_885175 [Zychaea mexicana]KAI9484731.1 hypothetical protein BDB00DRAFT_885175 [Zychaea mexicana]
MDSSYGSPVSSFIGDSYVRSTWIAFFTLWVLWGLAYIFRHAFLRDDEVAPTATDPAAAGTAANADPEAANKSSGFLFKARSGFNRRFRNFYSVLRDSLLMLLSVVALNTLGVGSTRAVLILAWIFVIFTILYAIADFIFEHRFIRIGFSTILYAIGLAIGGSAIARGWKLY